MKNFFKSTGRSIVLFIKSFTIILGLLFIISQTTELIIYGTMYFGIPSYVALIIALILLYEIYNTIEKYSTKAFFSFFKAKKSETQTTTV